MKVKSGVLSLKIKKKNVLPTTSKLLRQKAFKSKNKEGKNSFGLVTSKVKTSLLSAVKADIDKLGLSKRKNDNLKSQTSKQHVFSKKPMGNQKKMYPTNELQTINFSKKSQKQTQPQLMSLNPKKKRKRTKKGRPNSGIELLPVQSALKQKSSSKWQKKKRIGDSTELNLKKDIRLNESKTSANKHNTASKIRSPKVTLSSKKSKKDPALKKLPSVQSKLSKEKVTSAVTSLLKLNAEKSDDNNDLLDIAEPVYLQVECIKIPICPTKNLRFKLPHPLVNETSDILLITEDKKGAKIYPEKAVEHYTELLEKHEVRFINQVMPVRMVRQEYSQYEMRRKLVDQFDLILADAKINKLLPKLLGKFICYKRKMPIVVHLDRQNLKEHLLTAMSKTQMTVKSNGNTSTVQVGHTKMTAEEVSANVIEVSQWLIEMFPGGWENIRSLTLKTSNSPGFPVYLSLLSPNMVRIPVEQPKKRAPVVGELSTMPGKVVVVRPDGTVVLKDAEGENDSLDDSMDDEILQEAEKYMQSSKTVRYDDSDEDEERERDGEDSDKEADAVTAAMEQQLLNNYQSSRAGGSDGEEEDEDEESSGAEEDIVPIPGKKRKRESKKKPPPSKKLKKGSQSEKIKGTSQSPHGSLAKKGGVQKRGSRGGKKNKISKDQRKALIKQKKAGKK